MSKRKQKHKNDRRIKEVQRAQSKNYSRVTLEPEKSGVERSANKEAARQVEVQSRHTLPIKEIKIDLIKNILFALFSVAVLLILQKTGYGADSFHNFFKL